MTNWVINCPSTSRIRISTDCQGSLALKWKREQWKQKWGQKGSVKVLWPPMVDSFSSIVKNIWPTEIKGLSLN